MSIAGVLLDIIRWIFAIMGFVGVVGVFPSIVTSIVFFVLSSNEKDEVKKKSKK